MSATQTFWLIERGQPEGYPSTQWLDCEIEGLLEVERYDPDGIVLRSAQPNEAVVQFTSVQVRGMRVDRISEILWKVYYR